MDFLHDVTSGVNISNPGHNIGFELVNADPITGGGGTLQEFNIGNVGDPIGYSTRETGEGAYPYHQGIRLENIPADQILTLDDFADGSLAFDFEIQSVRYQFSVPSSSLVTYQDVIDAVEANTPAIVTFYSPTINPINPHQIEFQSHVASTATVSGVSVGNESRIQIRTFAGVTFSDPDAFHEYAPSTLPGVFADVKMPFPEPTAAHLLTKVTPNDDTVLEFSVGRNKNMAVRGFQAETYQDVIDTLNKFDGVNALYERTGRNKNNLYIYIPLPKSPKISEVTSSETETNEHVITNNALLRGALTSRAGSGSYVQIDDFSGLTTNSSILHVLRNSVAGGYTLLEVLQQSKRSNGSYWTEIVPIESDKKNTNEVSYKIDEQADLIDAIDADTTVTPDIKRKASLDLSTIISIAGALSGGKATAKSAAISFAIGKIVSLFNTFKTDAVPTTPPSTNADDALGAVIDDGYAPGALDGNGDVADASLLTPAQKSKLVPKPRNTVA